MIDRLAFGGVPRVLPTPKTRPISASIGGGGVALQEGPDSGNPP